MLFYVYMSLVAHVSGTPSLLGMPTSVQRGWLADDFEDDQDEDDGINECPKVCCFAGI